MASEIAASLITSNGDIGDIIYVQLPGMPFYIINSLEMAQELCNKRVKINSDRKIGYMVKSLFVISHDIVPIYH